MNVVLKHTLASIGKNPGQTAIIVLTMIIITACVLLGLSVTEVLTDNAEIWTGATSCHADAIVHNTGDYDKYIETIEDCEFVEEHFYILDLLGTAQTATDNVNFRILLCDDVEKLNRLTKAVILSEKENDSGLPEITISEFMANNEGLSAGDVLHVNVNNSGVSPIVKDFFISAVAGNFSMYYTNGAYPIIGLISDVDSEMKFNKAYLYFDRSYQPPEGYDLDEYAKSYFSSRLKLTPDTFELNNSEELYSKSSSGTQSTLNIAVSVIILLMVFILYFSYSIIAKNRAGELVRFKAAGATPLQCVLIMLTEVVLYSAIGCSIGLIAGYYVSRYVTSILALTSVRSLALPAWKFIVAFAIGLTSGLLACSIPAAKVSVKPTRQLITGDIKQAKRVPIAVAATLTVLLAVCFALIFLRPNEYALPAMIAIIVI